MKYFCSLILLVSFTLTIAQHHEHTHAGSSTEHEQVSGETSVVVYLGDEGLELNPLLTAEGTFYLVLVPHHPESNQHGEPNSEANHTDHIKADHDASEAYAEVTITITRPSGEVIEASWDGLEPYLLDLTPLELGHYSLTLSQGDNNLESGFTVYEAQTTLANQVYAIFAPSPSLATRGLSEAFIYVFAESDNLHRGMMLKRKMDGMVHSSDEEWLTLIHEHFGGLKLADFSPMANRTIVNFAMVGAWDVVLKLIGEADEEAYFNIMVTEK